MKEYLTKLIVLSLFLSQEVNAHKLIQKSKYCEDDMDDMMDQALMGGKKHKSDPKSNLDSTSGDGYPLGLPEYKPTF